MLKKLLLPAALLLICTPANAQTHTLQFSDPIKVASGTSFGRTRPHVSLLTDGTPVVQWGHDQNENAWISRLIDTSFSTPVRINPSGFSANVLSWTAPNFAVAGDTVFAVYEHVVSTDFEIYLQRSTDGGFTWGNAVRVDTCDTWIARYPDVTVTAGGNPVVSYMSMDPGYLGAEYETARSLNGGDTFEPGVRVSLPSPGDVCDCCPGSISSAGSQVFVSYRNNDNNLRDMHVALSSDFAATWDTTVDVDNSNWNLTSCPSSGPSTFRSGDSLVTVWMSAPVSPARVWYSTLHTGTLQTGPTRRIDDSGTSSQNFPAIAGRGDTLAVVWDDNRLGTTDIFIRFSLTGPAGLQGPAQNAVLLTTNTQRNADVAFANGVFHLVWEDVIQNAVIYRQAQITEASATETESTPGDFNLFPNPASGSCTAVFTARQPGSGVLNIHSMQGALAKRVPFQAVAGQNEIGFSVEGLAPGLYFVTASGLLPGAVLMRVQ